MDNSTNHLDNASSDIQKNILMMLDYSDILNVFNSNDLIRKKFDNESFWIENAKKDIGIKFDTAKERYISHITKKKRIDLLKRRFIMPLIKNGNVGMQKSLLYCPKI